MPPSLPRGIPSPRAPGVTYSGTLEVLKLEEGRRTILATHTGHEAVRAEPFEAVELELAALWGDVGDGPASMA